MASHADFCKGQKDSKQAHGSGVVQFRPKQQTLVPRDTHPSLCSGVGTNAPTSSNTFCILVENTISGAAVFSSALVLQQSPELPPPCSISFTVHYESHHVPHLHNMENSSPAQLPALVIMETGITYAQTYVFLNAASHTGRTASSNQMESVFICKINQRESATDHQTPGVVNKKGWG